MKTRNATWLVASMLIASVGSLAAQGELVLSEFNNSGFDWTFDDFTAVPGPTSVRVYDFNDGWGGAGVNRNLNLSDYANGRMVVDMSVNSSNRVDRFELELLDIHGNTGKWTMNVGGAAAGVPQTLVTATTLAEPSHGIGNWQNLDLSQIRGWQILGDFGAPGPFDLDFDRLTISNSVPEPPPYAGFEPDAPWRAVAASRIEAIRKADLRVTVTDTAGVPIPGAAVDVAMQQHEFGFGSAVQARRLDPQDASNAQYQTHVRDLFNISTVENNLKWPPWEGEWGPGFSQQRAITAVNWLRDQAIEVRGHNLVWPGYNNLPQSVKNILDGAPLSSSEQQALRDLIAAHIDEIAGAFSGQLAAWDVVNEPRANHDIMDVLSEGNLAMVDWFQRAKLADPAAKLYLNDYGIISSGGGVNTTNQQIYHDFVEFLVDNGAPLEGIGFQGHFSESDLTGPEQLWQIFDRFAQFGLEMQITEFDFSTTDESLQAAYTRDILTAAFAHEGIDAFLSWGFWEDAHWRPDAAMFNSDWSIKPNGEEFVDLVFNQWWTNESALAEIDGEALFRAFKGIHDVTVSFNGFTTDATINLTEDGEQISIELPLMVGDVDGNGDFDCADVDALVAAIASGNSDATFDLNFDGAVDPADLVWWLARAAAHHQLSGPYLPGDANLDGFVDASDLNVWNSHKFTSFASYCAGDFNADGSIDTSDFNLWNAHKFQSSAVFSVCEPAVSPLLVILLSILGLKRRKRKQATDPCL